MGRGANNGRTLLLDPVKYLPVSQPEGWTIDYQLSEPGQHLVWRAADVTTNGAVVVRALAGTGALLVDAWQYTPLRGYTLRHRCFVTPGLQSAPPENGVELLHATLASIAHAEGVHSSRDFTLGSCGYTRVKYQLVGQLRPFPKSSVSISVSVEKALLKVRLNVLNVLETSNRSVALEAADIKISYNFNGGITITCSDCSTPCMHLNAAVFVMDSDPELKDHFRKQGAWI